MRKRAALFAGIHGRVDPLGELAPAQDRPRPARPRESCGPSSCRRPRTGPGQDAPWRRPGRRSAPCRPPARRPPRRRSHGTERSPGAGCSTTNRRTGPSGGGGGRASRPRPCPRAGRRAARGRRTPGSCARRRSPSRTESGALRARSRNRARRRLARTARGAPRRWRWRPSRAGHWRDRHRTAPSRVRSPGARSRRSIRRCRSHGCRDSRPRTSPSGSTPVPRELRVAARSRTRPGRAWTAVGRAHRRLRHSPQGRCPGGSPPMGDRARLAPLGQATGQKRAPEAGRRGPGPSGPPRPARPVRDVVPPRA